MRHEQIKQAESYNKVDIAAVWPASAQVAPAPIPEAEPAFSPETFRAAPAAPDVPAGVWRLLVAAYAGLLATFALATAGSAQSLFAIAICAVFLVAFFTVPRLFLAQEPKSGRPTTFEQFLAEGMETLTGHSSGAEALVQMLIVPAFLTLGVVAMGIAAAVYM